MSKTSQEVVQILMQIYIEPFGGTENQRYLMSWSDLSRIYGVGKLYHQKFEELVQLASDQKIYLFDLGEGDKGHLIGIIRMKTVDRWRKVPKKIVDNFIDCEDSNSAEEYTE